jgi:DNA-binding transcriptional LysR family regulator
MGLRAQEGSDKDMDVYQLQVFSSVFKNRSFSRASEELNLTQPSVSSHIKKLEEELGVKLFDRVGRKTMPTKEAETLYNQAEEIIQKLRYIKESLSKTKEEVKGLIKIGASSTPGSYIIPPLAAEFRKAYPDVFFQVTIDDSRKLAEMIVNGELLLGVVSNSFEHEMIDHLAMIEDELVIATPPGFMRKKEINPMELLDVPFLMWGEGSEMHKSMEKGHTEKGVSLRGLNIVAVLSSTDSVKEAVKSGLGVSILSRFAIKDDLKRRNLVEVKLKGAQMRQNYYVIAHKKRTLPGLYQIFLDFLKDRLL